MTSPASPPLRSIMEAALLSGLDATAFGLKLEKLAGSAPDPDRALRNLARILEAGFTSSLLRDLEAHPVLLSICFDVLGQSQYLADVIVRDPELLRWLTASDVLSRTRMAAELEAEARHSMGLFERSERRLDALRRFHRRELLRIGAREILQEADVETVTAELSALADVAARCVTDQAHADLNARLGADLPNRMAVLALGKLGGEELNFSSDIDLMFVYDEDGDLPSEAGRFHTWHEYHARLGEAIVRGLSEFTAEGHLYRVDMRLRPDGHSGPLAMSRAAMMTYYEARGASWERQMLIKARVIAGARDVGEQFIRDLQPFIYPRTTMSAPWEEIARMKETIEQQNDVTEDIKLGAGGIRDIEFLVQGLQLLFAGSDASLRTGHTLRGLDRLVAAGHIAAGDGLQMREAYMFFRSIEHRLQLLHGHQTHQLPTTDAERAILSRKLGLGDVKGLMTVILARRTFVRRHFEAFTRPRGPATDERIASRDAIAAALDSTGWSGDVRSAAADRLRVMMESLASRKLLEAALTHPRHRAWLTKASLIAPRLVERLTAEPLLLESLLGNADDLLRASRPAWKELRASDLRRYQLYNESRTFVRMLLDTTPIEAIERELSDLAEDVLQTVVESAGIPKRGIAICAMGKLGGREMGVGSDLDLVLLYDERRCERSTAEGVGRAIGMGFAGTPPLYPLDFRLRPEGRNAPLAVEIGYLRSYLLERAEPWELMAMTRFRRVWGDRTVSARALSSLRDAAAARSHLKPSYVRAMRRSMESQRVRKGSLDLKLSAGGLADIEFVAQAVALRHSALLGRRTVEVLRIAAERRWISRASVQSLLQALTELRRLESMVRLGSPTTTSVLPQDEIVLQALATASGNESARVLVRQLRVRMKSTRSVFIDALTKLRPSATRPR